MVYENSGRHFVCGDIHGMYDLLMSELTKMSFDFDKDHLHALGDLVDRGPDSKKVVELLDQPWFDSVMGNHEELMIDAHQGHERGHMENGGMWFHHLGNADRQALVNRVSALPLYRVVTTPTGRRIGLVHADMIGTDWAMFEALMAAPAPVVRNHVLWNRLRANEIKRGSTLAPIAGIDHVFFGHTVLPVPVTRANMSWIDTGSCFYDRLTLVELV